MLFNNDYKFPEIQIFLRAKEFILSSVQIRSIYKQIYGVRFFLHILILTPRRAV